MASSSPLSDQIYSESSPLLHRRKEDPEFFCARGLDYYRNLNPIKNIFSENLRMNPKLHLDGTTSKGKIQASMLFVTERSTDVDENDNTEALKPMYSVTFNRDSKLHRTPLKTKNPELLCQEGNFRFWKVPFKMKLGEQISYAFQGTTHDVQAPGGASGFDSIIFSCNGRQTVEEQLAHEKVGGISAPWKTVVDDHERVKANVLLGLGDQIYNDDVFEALPDFKNFQEMTLEEKPHAEFTDEMRKDLKEYLIRKYCNHFSQDNIKQMLAEVLSILTWDDHDIRDGFGSYKENLNGCPVFQGVFEVARETYLLFQHHTTVDCAENNDYIGDGYNQLIHLGEVAVLCLDGRSERTQTQVHSKKSREAIEEALRALPESCKHVIVMQGIPTAYPSLKLGEDFLSLVSDYSPDNLKKARKMPLELQDDLKDEGNSPDHIQETSETIASYQEIAQEKKMRFTLVSGDVHIAAAGEYTSTEEIEDVRNPKIIHNITTSAICNVPAKAMPPVLNVLAAVEFRDGGKEVWEGTKMRMTSYQNIRTHEEKTFIGKQNWLRLTLKKSNNPEKPPRLEGRLHTYEQPLQKTGIKKIWEIFVNNCLKRPVNFANYLLHCLDPDERHLFPIETGAIRAHKVYKYQVPGLVQDISGSLDHHNIQPL